VGPQLCVHRVARSGATFRTARQPAKAGMADKKEAEEDIDTTRYPADYDKWSDPFRIHGRKPHAVLWTIQASLNVTAVIICSAAMIALRFLMVPMTMAYFVTFLQAPIIDLFEKRPMSCSQQVTEETKDLPEEEQEMEEKLICNKTLDPKRLALPRDQRGNGSMKGMMIDCMLMGKFPHMGAVVMCFVVSAIGLLAIFSFIGGAFADFAMKEQEKVDNGEESMAEALAKMGNDYVDELEDSGVKIFRPLICDMRNQSVFEMLLGEKDQGVRYVNAMDPDNDMPSHRGTDLVATVNILNLWDYTPTPYSNCSKEKLFKTDVSPDEYQTYDELMMTVNTVITLVNDCVLVMLLALYIIMERPEGRTVSGDHPVMEEVEDLIKNYINLKTMISAVTGILSGFFMVISDTPLGLIFGLLSFLLNFIPNVGSAIAIVLPLPILILSPQSDLQKMIAFLGPTLVQGYVGNVLEPTLFGAALNLTAISILLALVLFAAVWGLPGAVICVPALGITKIVCHHTDHPQAKSYLASIREEKEVDDEKDIYWAKLRARRNKREAAEAEAMLAAEKNLGIGSGYADPKELEDMGGD